MSTILMKEVISPGSFFTGGGGGKGTTFASCLVARGREIGTDFGGFLDALGFIGRELKVSSFNIRFKVPEVTRMVTLR
jgi:hypothetical protein